MARRIDDIDQEFTVYGSGDSEAEAVIGAIERAENGSLLHGHEVVDAEKLEEVEKDSFLKPNK